MIIKSIPVLALAFLAGVICLQFQAYLPSMIWALVLLPVAVICLKYRQWLWLLMLLAGFFWSLLFAGQYLEHIPSHQIAGKNIHVTGQVVGLPEHSNKSTRFIFQIDAFELDGYQHDVPDTVRLSWYYPTTEVTPGQRWQLMIRLKPPNGFQNPGGFDYEAWLYQQGIHATGYVKKHADNQRLIGDGSFIPITALRYRLMNWIKSSVDAEQAGLLNALAIGYRGDINQQTWDLFIRTGTNHLIAISGLHIGLVAGFAWLLLSQFGRIPQLTGVVNRRFLLASSFVAAFVYAALAGFTIPTQRALIMLAVVYLGLFSYRQINLSQSLSVALLLVLLVSPVSVLSVGFWLSFLAVAAIGYSVSGRLPGRNRVLLWLWPQIAVITVLIPLGFYFFQQTSVAAFIANLVAIPAIGMLVLPLLLISLLISVVSESIATSVIQLSAILLDGLLDFLQFLSASSFAVLRNAQPDLLALVLAMIGMLLFFMPRAIPGRWLALLMFVPLFNTSASHLGSGKVELQVIDVGQGLSVLIRTDQHYLLFDTGARFSQRFDVGQRVVVPLLRKQSIGKLDKLIISNGDRDHIGGAQAVIDEIKVEQLLGRDIEQLQHKNKQLCQQGQSWHWDGVDFEILHPENKNYKKRNNHSCVLMVSTGRGSILLTADIEKKVEYQLRNKYQQRLSSSVLIAPHHGSNTSSTSAFIQQVDPQIVIYSSGYLNRYGFPKQAVVERYQQQGVQQLSTAQSGHIRLIIESNGRITELTEYRKSNQRYWHRKPSTSITKSLHK